MNRDEILRELRVRTGISRLSLPRYIDFEEKNGVMTLCLGSRCGVTGNMQQDAAAFEGWAVGIKAVMPEWNFCLDWNEPGDTANGHYQRFLYRVEKFKLHYEDWFSIAHERSTQALLIKDGEMHQLNAPAKTTTGRMNCLAHSAENLIENSIIRNQSPPLKDIFQISEFERQLPVGVFRRTVEKKNAIFTHGKSAVDIWGVTSAKELVLFELKAPGNEKVGAISELFFYAMVLADEQKGVFVRDGREGETIRATAVLKAMILAPKLHPLITEAVFDLLNAPYKGSIEFGYVEMTADFNFRRVF